MKNNFPSEFYEYLSKHTLIWVLSGPDRTKFTEIWAVNVNDRIFARTWNKMEKSWYTAFLKFGEGKIKFGKEIIQVYAKKLKPSPDLTLQINKAYLKKYTQKGNVFYAEGITQPEYADFTIEFLYKGPG